MKIAFIVASALFASQLAMAEVIQISVSKQSPELQSIERPKGGMSKEAVEAKFGAPQEIIDAVGTPPITTWVYPDFSVYFEHNTVLHSVLRNTPPPQE